MSQIDIDQAKTAISNSISKIRTPQRVKNSTIYELFHIFIKNDIDTDTDISSENLLSDKIKNCTSKLSIKFCK